MLQLKNICYDVDADRPGKARRILSDVSLDFPEKTVTVITGHNGSGKSTLIKLIMGIDRPTSGRVLFNGEDITDASVTERALKGFTIAFQQPVRFKGITVRDLLGAACRKKLATGEACNFLYTVGLCAKDYIDRPVDGTLSGGELKRIELATARGRRSSPPSRTLERPTAAAASSRRNKERPMEKLDLELLEKIAQLHSVPEGSFNIRKNGERLAANSTDEIQIVQKTDKPGIDIIVAAGVKNKSVHIPVILTVGDFQDTVYNDFFIGEDADVTIVAGCGIHNPGKGKAEHDGVHTFHLGKNSRVKYVERHYGEGVQGSKRVFDPVTNAFLESGSVLEMDTTQLGGVTFTDRMTEAVVGDGAKLLVKEKLLTDGDEKAISRFRVTLKGKDSTCDIVSRSVARGTSRQEFYSDVIGENGCFGHVECDGIILDGARILSTPQIDAAHPDASLVHEAAVGKIAGDQLIKLMSLGLTEKEAEDAVIKGFLH